MKLKPGQSLVSVTDSTAVLVIKASPDDVSLTCGGAEMVEPAAVQVEKPIAPPAANGAQLGKRYADADDTIELLCTKAGQALLAINGAVLSAKVAKPLPASD